MNSHIMLYSKQENNEYVYVRYFITTGLISIISFYVNKKRKCQYQKQYQQNHIKEKKQYEKQYRQNHRKEHNRNNKRYRQTEKGKVAGYKSCSLRRGLKNIELMPCSIFKEWSIERHHIHNWFIIPMLTHKQFITGNRGGHRAKVRNESILYSFFNMDNYFYNIMRGKFPF